MGRCALAAKREERATLVRSYFWRSNRLSQVPVGCFYLAFLNTLFGNIDTCYPPKANQHRWAIVSLLFYNEDTEEAEVPDR